MPGITPNPAASTFEGGQVVANGTPSQQNVYLSMACTTTTTALAAARQRRSGWCSTTSKSTRCSPIGHSAEFGGGAGAIINMITRGGTNEIERPRVRFFRDDRFNARNAFLPPDGRSRTR